MKPRSFRSARDFRSWLESHHAASTEINLRLRKAGAGGPGVTYAEALDVALGFGWIDGVRQAVDHRSYAVRFSPRRPRSIWSRVNLRHYARLQRAGLVAPAGRAAFAQRDPERSGRYSFESRPKVLPPAYRRLFEKRPAAWKHFLAQPPSYRRTAIFWVVSAKQETTRQRRLAQLIADSAGGRRLRMLTRPADRK
jgi:uncharacterized protein YdeI (YjbR/CyaY-like superfamily)